MHTAAVIVAAGRGSRFGGDLPKQWLDLAGKPVLAHTVAAFQNSGIARIVVVFHPDDATRAQAMGLDDVIWCIGSDTRVASVRAGLATLADDPPAHVLIHDGARPLVSAGLIARVCTALHTHPAAAPALAVADALWRGAQGRVSGTQDRTGLFRAQTPQGFHYSAITAAHATHPGGALDDVEVALAAGLDVAIVEGEEVNLKLTWPADFARAESLLKGQTMDIRTGNGFDVHAFCPGSSIWLCGVEIAHDKALLGHSDADVGMHALTDAIYGALAEGDIGQHFPPSDPQWKGAASHIFLRHAVRLAAERGFRLTHCDVTLICEAPKIGPHAKAMRVALSEIMGLETTSISVKATTSEQLGFTGRREGIAAMATATLVPA